MTDDWVYHNILNGVYKTGFAGTDEAYEEAFDALFLHIDKCEKMLEGKKFLFGEVFTYADLRLFGAMIRFDPVYVVHFKCNKKMIMNYPNLNKWVRRIYNDVTY